MDDILKDLGLGDHTDTFRTNSVTPHVVINMTDEDFNSVGITKIGDRVKLREQCRDHIAAEATNSPVLSRILSLQQQRGTRGKRRKLGNLKETRRVTVGWIHNKKRIVAGKGGGKQDLDIDRRLNYKETLEIFTKQYFPNGTNVSTGWDLDQLSYYIATYTGQPVTEIIGEDRFTFGDLISEMKASPVRLYLHTEFEDKESIGALVQDTPVVSILDSDDDFTDADTPTIQIRRRLILRRPLPNPESAEPTPSGSAEPTYAGPAEPTSSGSAEPTSEGSAEPSSTEPQSPSPQRVSTIDFSRSDLTLEEILDNWIQRTMKEDETTDIQEIVINRNNLLTTALRAMTRSYFDYVKPFRVNFKEELGDDQGGPKREFLAELMLAVNEDIFEGPDEEKIFKHDLIKLEQKKFEQAGKIVAFSILHGGSGLSCLNLNLFKLMTNREDTSFSEMHIHDMDTKERISEEDISTLLIIQQSNNQSAYSDAVQKHIDWMTDQGCGAAAMKYKDINCKDTIIQTLLKNYMYYRIHSEIAQFITGLNHVGNLFTDVIMKAPILMEPLFVCREQKLTLRKIRQIYKAELSDSGSNRRRKEDQVIYCFEAFMADCEGGATGIPLSAVLGFWTGATKIPPLGFQKKLEIAFVANEERRLPTAHTCGMVMELWLGYTDPDDFARDMEIALTLGKGFYLA